MGQKKSNAKEYAVITGDVVDSTKIGIDGKNRLLTCLKQTFAEIHASLKSEDDSLPAFSIFRGDSFQGVIEQPAKALWVGLLIRASLQENRPQSQEASWDARISIGTGWVDHLPKTISEGDGPAFRNSGPTLDTLKKDHKFAITTPNAELNAEFKTACALLDAVIDKWTPAQAEIVHMLLQKKAPKQIAAQLDISQAAVHYRVKGAGWFAIEIMLQRYNNIFKNN